MGERTGRIGAKLGERGASKGALPGIDIFVVVIPFFSVFFSPFYVSYEAQ